jgi:hypothetical protein
MMICVAGENAVLARSASMQNRIAMYNGK